MVAGPSPDEFLLKDEVTGLSPAQLLQRATSFVELGKLALSNPPLNPVRVSPAQATRYFGYATVCLLPHRAPSVGLRAGHEGTAAALTLPPGPQKVTASKFAFPNTLVGSL